MRVIAIIGPTASGKTGLSLEIAGDFFEIVSADSVQVYRYMDIGSSKPTKQELNSVRHHLVDIVDPDYNFTAGEFSNRAAGAIEDITSRGKMPLVVGGTGFYINSLFYGIDEIPDIDESVRESVAFEYDNAGADAVYKELFKVDPAFAARVHMNDRQRVIRGLSVYRGTGKPISDFFLKYEKKQSFETLFIGLHVDRGALTDRISGRVDLMIKNGLVEEVRNLRSMGYSPALNSMQSIGYSEINSFLDAKVSLNDAVTEIKRNTVKYAKKQMTWFKKNSNVVWFDPDNKQKIPDVIKGWLN